MIEDLIKRFTTKYEFLRGITHVAADAAEAADIAASILKEVEGQRVALGDLPDNVMQIFENRCREDGAEVIKPPYNRSDLPDLIDKAHVGISWTKFAIAETGTLVETNTDDSLRLVSLLPRVHVGLIMAEDLVDTLPEAAPLMRDFFSHNSRGAVVTFISGPSRTGDIEMRLTLGVHGPEVSHAIVIRSKNGSA